MKAFQRDFLSNTVASVHTWEKMSDMFQLAFHEQNGVSYKMKLTSHPSTFVACPFYIQISEPPKVYDYSW